jgi:hypothetical protein
MREMRKGVVLFITLSIIAAMLAMVGVIFTYMDRSRENASHTAAMIQANLLFRDSRNAITALLKKNPKDKEMKKTVLSTLYLAPVTLQAANDEALFSTLTCSPLDAGVDINWLALENNSSAQAQYSAVQTLFDQIAERRNIQNAPLLLTRILAAVTGVVERDERKGRLEQKKGIISLSQMQGIVRDYRFEEDDPSVEEIAWDKFFTFDPQSQRIDGNFLSEDLIALLFDIELDFVQEEWIGGDDLKKFVVSHGGDISQYKKELFAEEPVERMRCQVSYGYQERVYAFGFDYIEGKAERFEFLGEQ